MGNPEMEGRTEKPTPKKLKEAQKKGQVAKSQDLVAWTSIFIASSVLEKMFVKASNMMQYQMERTGQLVVKADSGESLQFLIESLQQSFFIVLPVSGVFMALAIVGYLAQTKAKLATKALKPNFKKLNPLPGIKRMFSPKSLVTGLKQAFKMTAVGILAYFTIYQIGRDLVTGGPYPMGQLMVTGGKAAITFIRNAAVLVIVIGLFDYAWQKRENINNLKMTKQQVRDETKNQDLPAEVRMKIRQKQREFSRNRMMAALNDADVVVVNPVHLALALSYDNQQGAPKVVAKGAGALAEKIREKALEHEVPLIQDIPLARALHAACEIDDEIPMELFEAVARVLAFVYGLKQRGMGWGLHVMPGSPDLETADQLEAERFASTGRSLKAQARHDKTQRSRAMRTGS